MCASDWIDFRHLTRSCYHAHDILWRRQASRLLNFHVLVSSAEGNVRFSTVLKIRVAIFIQSWLVIDNSSLEWTFLNLKWTSMKLCISPQESNHVRRSVGDQTWLVLPARRLWRRDGYMGRRKSWDVLPRVAVRRLYPHHSMLTSGPRVSYEEAVWRSYK